jgi:hypothetical protein
MSYEETEMAPQAPNLTFNITNKAVKFSVVNLYQNIKIKDIKARKNAKLQEKKEKVKKEVKEDKKTRNLLKRGWRHVTKRMTTREGGSFKSDIW